jgi:hypothetical protein
MGEIAKLPPAYRITPGKPTGGAGQSNNAPQRKPATGDRESDDGRQRRKKDDDDAHIDEYA